MKNNCIIGRKNACHELERMLLEKEAALVIVTGRRRVGKTFLINEFFNNKFTFKITGDYKKSRLEQITSFFAELKTKTGKEYEPTSYWPKAFELLREYLDTLSQRERKVIFFDEFPWLDSQNSGFLTSFEYFWNHYLSTQKNLLFIICGSASSWIENKIVKNKGGLYNRHTSKIHLYPFDLKETEQYLNSRNIHWSKYDIASLYMITGGIPYYLRMIDSSLSLGGNIDRLFFAKDALLKDEFETLFKTLFTKSEQYVEIAKCLSKFRLGLTREEIAKKLKIALNGDLSDKLDKMIQSGFVNAIDVRNGKKRVQYVLSDYFSLFYLHFINGKNGVDHHFWSKSFDLPSIRAWKGLAFEQLCFDHIDNIKKALGISGVLSEEYSWQYLGSEEENGAQIDMIIQRRDRTINICEMKFVNEEYSVSKDYYFSLMNKTNKFIEFANKRDTIQLTLVTTYGLKLGKYSNCINSIVTLDDLFE